MKILHVNNKFHFQGGSEQYLYAICCELARIGHKNVVVHGGAAGMNGNAMVAAAYHIHGLNDFNGRMRSALREQVRTIIERATPDIVYIHNITNPYLVEAMAEMRPVIKYVHDHEFYCAKGIRIVHDKLCTTSFLPTCVMNAVRGNGYLCMGGRSRPMAVAKTARKMFMNRRVHHGISHFIVAGSFMQQSLISQGYHEDRISVIPYFTEIPRSAVPESGSNTILFVGRISPEKGLEIFLESLLLLEQDFRFVIVGEGEPAYVSILKNSVREKKLEEKVEFAGWVGNSDIGSYLEKSAFLVVPSIWPEPFGIVGIESMAHGRPAVAFDVGGIPDWLDDRHTGFLIERNNIHDLARRMDLLLRDRELRQDFGRTAYEQASSRFSKEMHLEKLIRVFTDVLSSKK
jgi:glycosyltransferase involved in cell wall biosynthesis